MRFTMMTVAIALTAVALAGCSTTCTSCNKRLPVHNIPTNNVHNSAHVDFQTALRGGEHRAQPIPTQAASQQIQQVIHWGATGGCGCAKCNRGCGRHGGRGGARHLHGNGVPHTPPFAGPYGAPAPQYAYPFYTTRGPRDFLQDGCGPAPIVPATPREICLPSIGW